MPFFFFFDATVGYRWLVGTACIDLFYSFFFKGVYRWGVVVVVVVWGAVDVVWGSNSCCGACLAAVTSFHLFFRV